MHLKVDIAHANFAAQNTPQGRRDCAPGRSRTQSSLCSSTPAKIPPPPLALTSQTDKPQRTNVVKTSATQAAPSQARAQRGTAMREIISG